MNKKLRTILIVGVIAFFSLSIGYLARSQIRVAISTTSARLSQEPNEPYPIIETENLSIQQKNIINFTKAEYEKQAVSYDVNVLEYTEGVKEAWCADFISWTMLQAEIPLSNPHSGHWRIPGVLTLQEYYKENNRYVDADGYQPSVGDVAIYIGRHTLGLLSRQHANIVIAVDDNNMMTTIGGNENGRLKLVTQPIKENKNSLVGFGKLQ